MSNSINVGDLELLENTTDQAVSLQHSLKQTAVGAGLYVNSLFIASLRN